LGKDIILPQFSLDLEPFAFSIRRVLRPYDSDYEYHTVPVKGIERLEAVTLAMVKAMVPML